MSARLLIISCSNKKDDSKNKLPAIKRYTGAYYKVLNKLMRENKFPEDVELLIISAKYGLLKPNELIDYYDLKMTYEQAKLLNKRIISKLKIYLKNKCFDEIFINLGKEYMASISGFQELIHPRTKVIIAKGRIGERMKQMKEWLCS